MAVEHLPSPGKSSGRAVYLFWSPLEDFTPFERERVSQEHACK